MLRAVRMIVARVLAAFFALTWLVLPGFGLIDLSVTWDADWPVVLETGWGVFMTVLVGGSFLAATVAPYRTAPAEAVLLVGLATCTTPSRAHWPWRCRRSPCWPHAGAGAGAFSASPSISARATCASCPSRSQGPGPVCPRSGRPCAWPGAPPSPCSRWRRRAYSRASSAARSSRPSDPCDSAAMCHAFRSKASPRARCAAARPSSHARSPSL